MKKIITKKPSSNATKEGSENGNLKREYGKFFSPNPSPLWQHDDSNYSLEQPSFLKILPTETIYGIS